MAKRGKAQHQKKPSRLRGSEGAALSVRPTWQGHLRLSLVSCPVALFSATTRANDVSFHLLNPKTNSRIRMIPTDPDTGPVDRSTLVKGFEISKNNYVVVTQRDLDAVKLETTSTIDIERFVDEKDIDRLFWDSPYYLVPNDKSGIEAYLVIRDALRKTNQVALGRVVMHTRERLVALEPRDKGIVVCTLRMRNEVVDPGQAFDDIPSAKTDPKMIEIAIRIVEQLKGAFDPDRFQDRYEQALKDLIRRKERGERIVTAEPVEDTNVIDLMAALRESLARKGRAQETERRVRRRVGRAKS